MNAAQEIQAICDAAAIVVDTLGDRARRKRSATWSRMATDAIQIADAAHELLLRYQIETLVHSPKVARYASEGGAL